MKNCWIFLIIISFMSLISCSKKDETYNDSTKLILNISIDNRTRISKQSFEKGDKIGFYLVNYVNNMPGILGNILNTEKVNIEYEYNGTFWNAPDGEEIYLNNTYSDLYAYYPYDYEMNRTNEKMNLAAYPFSIQTDQSSSLIENDFLWSKVTKLNNENSEAQVIFQHLMGRCEINLKFNDSIEKPEDPNLKIHNTKTHCTINLRVGEVFAIDGNEIIHPQKNSKTNTGFDKTYDVILIPQIIEKGTPFFSVNIDNYTLIYELEEDLTISSQELYVFNMTVGSAQLP